MQRIKDRLSRERSLVFMFCLAVIAGPALAIFLEHDMLHFPDCKTYLGLAHFNLLQNPVRRYRVIIPFIAGALNFLFGGIFGRLAPAYFSSDYSLSLCFFFINTIFTAFSGLIIYRYCKAFGVHKTSAIIGTLAFLTCRYTFYMAALPLVDSLFYVAVSITLAGIKLKDTPMLLWAIFLGPFAKESFLFIAPLIFFFSHLSKKKMILYFASSGLSVFTFRYGYDIYLHQPAMTGFAADMRHLPNLIRYLPKLFSVRTAAIIMMNIGLWGLAPLFVLFIRPIWGKVLLATIDSYLIYFMLSVLVQMLLSGSMERMFYPCMPVFCAIIALSVDELRKINPAVKEDPGVSTHI